MAVAKKCDVCGELYEKQTQLEVVVRTYEDYDLVAQVHLYHKGRRWTKYVNDNVDVCEGCQRQGIKELGGRYDKVQ